MTPPPHHLGRGHSRAPEPAERHGVRSAERSGLARVGAREEGAFSPSCPGRVHRHQRIYI